MVKDLSSARNFEDRLFGELAAISGDIAGLDARLAAVEISLSVLENRLTAVENRLSMLEDRVDARLVETRPIWEAVQSSIKRLDQKFDTVIQDLYEVRTDSRVHDKLLREHEQRLNPS